MPTKYAVVIFVITVLVYLYIFRRGNLGFRAAHGAIVKIIAKII